MFKNKQGIIRKIRQSRTFRGVSALVLFSLLFEIAQPTVSLALTEGPSQPEVQSFEPIGTTQMVDLFSGDFNYNIPLFNLPGPNGGYPVNLAYHAGATMDDEASWVGLGWNINAGSLVRDMRGLPDEFRSSVDSEGQAANDKDHLIVKQDRMPNRTFGGTVSFNPEIFGAELDASISISLSVYHNNYKGMGAGVGINYAKSDNSPFAMGLSIDGENGLGVSASLKKGSMGGESSHKVSLNMDGNLSLSYEYGTKQMAHQEGRTFATSSFGTGYSFARTMFSPSTGSRADNWNIKIGVGGGANAVGLFAKGSFSLFFNTEDLDETDKDGRRTPVVGYERSGESDVNQDFVRDFSRSNDGQLTRSSIFLANTNYTFDTYNSTGQGLSGYFRARRNDVGKVFDPHILNNSQGLNLLVELGVGTGAEFGIDPGLNWGSSEQQAWTTDNDLDFDFSDPYASGINENMYYQAHGEQTILHPSEYDHIKGLSLATAYFSPKVNDGLHNGKRKIENENNEWYANERKNGTIGDRVVRNTLIHTLRNFEVGSLGEFNVGYYSASASLYLNPDQTLNRSTRPFTIDGTTTNVDISKHNAGFKVLNEEGSYYVYGLPAYNNKEISNTFSTSAISASAMRKQFSQSGSEADYEIADSHKSIYKTTKTPYAHSYLLTSVLGADYIDLTNNGPSDDDMGYWVNMDYVKSTGNYNWRAPYENNMGQTLPGAAYTPADDKLSYQSGEKELWYLGRMETKSHVAVFVTEARRDGKESNGELPNDSSNGDKHRVLKEIRVYDKKSFAAQGSNAVALQVVHFEYDYSMCPNVTNNDQAAEIVNGTNINAAKGKLTLKSVWFTSNGSERGKQSKYEFGYAGTTGNPGVNPAYTFSSFDAWGSYQPVTTGYEHQIHFPYVNQFNQGFNPSMTSYYGGNTLANEAARTTTKQNQDNFASAWCLTKIKLPSGGTINIKYESDDYGYVQHKTANQMFEITKLGDYTEPDELYNTGNENYVSDPARRRIYFKLEYPIAQGSANIPHQIYRDYVEPIIDDEAGNKNLYFKSRMRLTRTPDVYDYVSGYLPLEKSESFYGVGTQTATIDGVTCYTHGFVTVKAAKKKNGTDYFEKYHPMALAAWTYLQTNAQQLLNNPNSFSSSGASDEDQLLGQAIDFLNAVPSVAQSLGAIRSYCKEKDMARFIDLNQSCVRLASPDKIKYGGGHRVKEISITDNWSGDTGNTETDHTYGQRFDYTISETIESGLTRKISSGVATYEPQAGGDENPLKYPINYFDKQTVFTSNNLFAEGPMNEELFPGPSIGYRRVTVTSINTDEQMKKASDGNSATVPVGRTGGVTVNEYYTAKEFPTIVKWSDLKEENSTKEVFLLPIIIPFIGSLKRDYFYGSQSFLIELNDMHGKPKSVKSYELNNYVAGANPISASEFEYQVKSIEYQGESVFQLDNNVNIIPNNGKHGTLANASGDQHTRMMGVEAELFTDQREFSSEQHDFALDFNLELPFFPIITVWPTINDSKSMFRTYVTNKVIHRTGILKRKKVRDLQSVNESEVIAYDEKSGVPLLTRAKNEFGDDFYNYNVPAYYAYDRMGHAYRNINYSFTTNVTSGDPTPDPQNPNLSAYLDFDAAGHLDYLVRGDELLITAAPNSANLYKKVYFLGWKYTSGGTKGILHSPFGTITAGNGFSFKVIRSGRRNNFGTPIANYLTKGRFENLIRTNSSDPNSVNLVTIDPNDTQIQTPQIASGVLSAAASIYRDDWSASVQTDLSNDLITENPFLTGNSGIWRLSKMYSYIGPRKTSASMNDNTNSDPQLYNDGVFEEPVKMFSWELGSIEDYLPKWEWTNEVTRYSTEVYELESRDRLGIFSSMLYGYDNSLSIGVSSNAEYHESGVFDFETIVGMASGDFMKIMSQTNLNFDNHHTAAGNGLITEQYRIKKATVSGNKVIISAADNPDIPVSYFLNNSGMVGISITTRKNTVIPGNKGFYFNALIRSKVSTQLELEPFLRRGASEKLVEDNAVYHGVVSFFIPRVHKEINDEINISYVSEKAHSGKKSMKLTSSAVFDQPRLKLKETKKYILSVWVSRQQENVATFKLGSSELIEVGKMNGAAFSALTATIVKYGKIVEGWQKIDIEFAWADDPSIPGTDIPAIRFTAEASNALYVDDLRVSPKTGGIMTYVYDLKTFKVTASLNSDNYATFFYYDEEGHLHLKKQETEKGIFTLLQSRGHVSK